MNLLESIGSTKTCTEISLAEFEYFMRSDYAKSGAPLFVHIDVEQITRLGNLKNVHKTVYLLDIVEPDGRIEREKRLNKLSGGQK
jgi:hypothetical protein